MFVAKYVLEVRGDNSVGDFVLYICIAITSAVLLAP